MNRHPVNAFNLDLLRELYKKLVMADEDNKVKCVVIKSTGTKAFSAGMDMKMMSNPANLTPEDVKDLLKHNIEIVKKMILMKKPIIAIVQGTAIGFGMMVVMASDLRLFADRPFPEMFFNMPEMALSMYPRALCMYLILRSFGLTFGKNIFLSSEKFGLEKLKNINFPAKVFPWDENFEKNCNEYVNQIAKYKESNMFLVKSTMTLMHNKYIERWLELEEESAGVASRKRPGKNWDEFIQNLFDKYP
jgi:enoyl-CoA hydratase/carnithine racemase